MTVQEYIARLNEAGLDKPAFDAAVNDIRNDRSIGTPEANAIAQGYTESKARWPSKGQALKEIDYSFRERSHEAVKMRRVDKASRFI